MRWYLIIKKLHYRFWISQPSRRNSNLIKQAAFTQAENFDINYAVSDVGGTQPATFPYTTVPTVDKGQWLWVKTTYSDNNIIVTKLYVGTDGEDGEVHVGRQQIWFVPYPAHLTHLHIVGIVYLAYPDYQPHKD